MRWKRVSQKSNDGDSERGATLDELSDTARNDDDQLGRDISKKRVIMVALGALLALCLMGSMANCAGSHKQPDNNKRPSLGGTEEVAKANPNAKGDKVDEESQKAGEEMNDETSGSSDATPTSEASDNDNSGRASGGSNGGNSNSDDGSISSNSGGGSKPQHTHNWVPQTTVVRHEAQYQTFHHDAVYGTGVECNGCSAQFNSLDAWKVHSDSRFEIEGFATKCTGYHTIKIALEQAWDETVEISPAWDETVITGYYCSGCDAAK